MRASRLVCLIIGGTMLSAPLAARDRSCAEPDAAEAPAIFVLAPKQGGLTMSTSPTLYWFVPQGVRGRIELAVTPDDDADDPVVDETIDAPAEPGIYGFSLADRRIKLSPGRGYQWSATLSVDPMAPDRDIVATGHVVASAPSPELTRKLLATPEHAWPAILAEASLWYDAFAAVSRQVAAEPAARVHREKRAALLDQAGLKEAAAFERAK